MANYYCLKLLTIKCFNLKLTKIKNVLYKLVSVFRSTNHIGSYGHLSILNALILFSSVRLFTILKVLNFSMNTRPILEKWDQILKWQWLCLILKR